MADIQTYLDAIENAVYGEDVRGSIHDAIEIINDVGEKVITAGTAVTSPSSSVEGFFDDSLYFNTNTDDLWQCNGTGWTLLGNLKGSQGNPGNPGQAATIAVGTVTKGDNASVVNSGTSSAAVFDFVLPKGDPGPAGVNTWGSITGDLEDQTDLKNALGDVYDQSEELVDRTVGWICDNLFDIEAVEMGKDIYGEAAANSALFTLNCKPSTRYYLSVHGTNNLQVSYNTTALGPTEVLIASFPYDFLTTQYDTYIKICFTKSGLTKSDIEALQFMLTEVANAPYSEYHPPVSDVIADVWSVMGENGAKNRLPITLSALKTANTSGTWSGNVYTYNTVTYTIETNSDGSVAGIAVNGTANALTYFILDKSFNTVKYEGYLINGFVEGSASVFRVSSQNDFVSLQEINANDTQIKNNGSNCRLSLRLDNGASISNKVFKPMLRLASDPDGTYAPYAMPNRELTDAVMSENLDISLGEITATLLRNDSRKKGDIVNVRIQFQVTTELAKDTTLFTKLNCPHPGFGSGTIIETNSGNIYPVVAWSSTSNLAMVVKSAIPAGYYALNYTYIQ